MRIKLLQPVGEHATGATIPVDDAVGRKYVAAGIAESATDGASVLDGLSKTIKDSITEGFATLDKAVRTDDPNHPSSIRIDAGEQEADRRKSFADYVKQVIILGCRNLATAGMLPYDDVDPGRAMERLDKVYNSRWRAAQKDLAEGSGGTGGYTVAPLYVQELLKLTAEMSLVRPYANVKTLPAREAYFPMLDQTTAPTAGNTRYYGGVQMTWTGEAAARPSTEPNFKQVHIVTHELAGLCKISRTLLSDSMLTMESELRQLFAGAISWYEDYAFLQGDGNAKPKGILNSAALITYASRATSNHFKLADAANMMGAMMPESRPKSVWLMTNNLFSDLVQLQDASGRVTYLPNVGTGYGEAKIAAGQMGQILLFSRPCLFTEKLPAIGTVGDVLLVDLSKYIVADTGTLEIAASDQYAFNTNQITFRIIQRVDGQAQVDAPFTQQDGSTQISPFVALHA